MRELYRRMDGAELMDWFIYESIEPFGDQRADLRMGIMASSLINIQLDRKSTPTKPSDFIPNFFQPIVQPKKQDTSRMMAMLRAGTEVVGGKIK